MSTEQAVINCQYNAAVEAMAAEWERKRPFYLLKPPVYPDGDQWCALYGVNIQEGVCGFGDTPTEAAVDFDLNWLNQKAG